MNSTERDLRLARLEALIDNFPGIAYRYRNDGAYTLEYVSGRVAEITGYPLEDFRNRRIRYTDLVLSEDFAPTAAAIDAALQERGHYEVTYRLRNAAGDVRYMWERGVGIRDGGEIAAVEGFVVDITDRKRMEDALKTSEARLNLALREARLGTWDWDLASGAIVWSEGHARLWGMELAAFRGTYDEFASRVHPDDLPILEQLVQKAIATKSEYNSEFRVVWPDQSVHWAAGRGHALYADGRPFRMIGVVMDITERREMELQREAAQEQLRESERTLRDILDSMFAFVTVLTTDGVMVETNRAPLDALNLTREQVIGAPFADGPWFPPTTQELLRTSIARAALGETTRIDMQIRNKKGEIMDLDSTFGPLYDAHGVVTRIIGFGVDVTERRQAESLRHNLEAQLWQAQKMEALGTLAGGVAHDFNNILSIITGNVEIARQDVGADHPAITSLDEIRKAGTRAKNVVKQILAFTRKQVMERRVISLQPLIEECATMLRATLPAHVSLKVTCSEHAPLVLADPTQMHQVVLNLATNAWHALDDEPGIIEISLKPVAIREVSEGSDLRPGEYACICVSDTGVGMDGETLARAFEPFYTTKEAGKGSGLGLSVVEGIVKSHEGVIHVSSKPGKGSTFSLYFPAATKEADFIQTTVLAQSSDGRGQTILFLDDDEAIVTVAVKTLERLGYRAVGFTDPQRALQAVRTDPHRFDLVITDYTMPGISGLLAARQIAQIRPALAVVLTSGYVTDDLLQRANELGVKEVVHKPYEINTLCDIVQRILRGG